MLEMLQRDFPRGPVVKTLTSKAGGKSSIPGFLVWELRRQMLHWEAKKPTPPPKKHIQNREFPGNLVVEVLPFYCRRHSFDPWLGSKEPTMHTD